MEGRNGEEGQSVLEVLGALGRKHDVDVSAGLYQAMQVIPWIIRLAAEGDLEAVRIIDMVGGRESLQQMITGGRLPPNLQDLGFPT